MTWDEIDVYARAADEIVRDMKKQRSQAARRR
jgi:hypothetical protein